MNATLKSSKETVIAGGYGLLTFVLTLSLAWFVFANNDFFYGFWHDNVGISEGIEYYGPQNRFRPGFADTTRQQRLELFAAVTSTVHSDGEGLDDITYQTPTSKGPQALLRQAEIIHLKDVAELIDALLILIAAVFIAWPAATYICYTRSAGLPSLKSQLTGLSLFGVFLAVVLLLFGAENVFNQLHIWIFPDEHQWFFYYEDSLMSTMMLAPVLFGWIALALGGLSVVFFAVIHFALAQLD